MSVSQNYGIILFPSVSYALKAEKLLLKSGLPFKLIPVPKHISPDCGVCIRFEYKYSEKIKNALEGVVQITVIRALE